MFVVKKKLLVKILLVTMVVLFLVQLQYNGSKKFLLNWQSSWEANSGEELFDQMLIYDFIDIALPMDTLSVLERVKKLIYCEERPQTFRNESRGDYQVLYNYVQAEKTYHCHESITFATQADYPFLDNLIVLIQRWDGPISVALHASGHDFQETMNSIAYLRDCTSLPIKERVTFHVYFHRNHPPKTLNHLLPYNCSLAAPFLNVDQDKMYKIQNNLLYPINVGRNIARETASTHFILGVDIELYPSINFIKGFLGMISRNEHPINNSTLKVFALPPFEVLSSVSVPDNKNELQKMLLNGTAFPFHEKLCSPCHNIPFGKKWQELNVTSGLHVFSVSKRAGDFYHWEPCYVGTHSEPQYDEELTWDGKFDGMVTPYVLCILEYDIMVLDNAFLVHKPGVKVVEYNEHREIFAKKNKAIVNKIILPKLDMMYGANDECSI